MTCTVLSHSVTVLNQVGVSFFLEIAKVLRALVYCSTTFVTSFGTQGKDVFPGKLIFRLGISKLWGVINSLIIRGELSKWEKTGQGFLFMVLFPAKQCSHVSVNGSTVWKLCLHKGKTSTLWFAIRKLYIFFSKHAVPLPYDNLPLCFTATRKHHVVEIFLKTWFWGESLWCLGNLPSNTWTAPTVLQQGRICVQRLWLWEGCFACNVRTLPNRIICKSPKLVKCPAAVQLLSDGSNSWMNAFVWTKAHWRSVLWRQFTVQIPLWLTMFPFFFFVHSLRLTHNRI